MSERMLGAVTRMVMKAWWLPVRGAKGWRAKGERVCVMEEIEAAGEDGAGRT